MFHYVKFSKKGEPDWKEGWLECEQPRSIDLWFLSSPHFPWLGPLLWYCTMWHIPSLILRSPHRAPCKPLEFGGHFYWALIINHKISASSLHRWNNFSVPRALTASLWTVFEAFHGSWTDGDASGQEWLAKLMRRPSFPAGSMPWSSCTLLQRSLWFLPWFSKILQHCCEGNKWEVKGDVCRHGWSIEFSAAKWEIEVRFRGLTRPEENQENKDHFVCFPSSVRQGSFNIQIHSHNVWKNLLNLLHLYIVPSHCQS